MVRAIDYAIRFARGAAPAAGDQPELRRGQRGRRPGAHRSGSSTRCWRRIPTWWSRSAPATTGRGSRPSASPAARRRAISVGATLPGSFLPAGPAGAPSPDQLAYFSSRGGEVARPDLVTPGVAYSTVPRWDAGEEVNQGTSMAAPHAAGIAALLVSALTQEKRPVVARDDPAGAHGHGPADAGRHDHRRGHGHSGCGPRVPLARRRPRRWPTSRCARSGAGNATAAVLRRSDGAADTIQGFELRRPAGAPPATYTLRSDAPWLTAPATLALRGARATVQLRVARRSLAGGRGVRRDGDRLDRRYAGGPRLPARDDGDRRRAGRARHPERSARQRRGARPAARSAPSSRPTADGPSRSRSRRPVGPSGRSPSSTSRDGMPFRDEGARTAGFGPQAAEYEADSRDVISGAYEAVVVAPPTQGAQRLGRGERVAIASPRRPRGRVGARRGHQRHRGAGGCRDSGCTWAARRGSRTSQATGSARSSGSPSSCRRGRAAWWWTSRWTARSGAGSPISA